MRLIQVLLVLVALLAFVAAETLSKENEDRLSSITDTSTPTDERIDIQSFNGGTIVYATRPNEGNPGGKVTVTSYNNDGIWNRIKKWWKTLISREERLGYADARSAGIVGSDRLATNTGTGGIVSRVGTGGTVSIHDNNKGGGTVTVTVYNNNGLFSRVCQWWKRIITHVTAGSSYRLRKIN
ncbi:hypothetical protein PHMEG_00041223 [Phytophthora megakarya]|uniref:RxLR effector protein n=1 Tax=Phytophthora megakarya TaxID=4795 RepID=A0A225UC08_9STRA|nr:hypothetical protein PHMEG_00041223 [Phytophthora megakarya]